MEAKEPEPCLAKLKRIAQMAEYTVQCDHCLTTHETSSSWKIVDFIIGSCEYCGADLCVDCEGENKMHKECYKENQEEVGDE